MKLYFRNCKLTFQNIISPFDSAKYSAKIFENFDRHFAEIDERTTYLKPHKNIQKTSISVKCLKKSSNLQQKKI